MDTRLDIAAKHGVSYGATHRACNSAKHGPAVVPRVDRALSEPKAKKSRTVRQYEIAKFGGVRVLHNAVTPGEVIGLDVSDGKDGHVYTLRVLIRS